jgi:hypothetical protein
MEDDLLERGEKKQANPWHEALELTMSFLGVASMLFFLVMFCLVLYYDPIGARNMVLTWCACLVGFGLILLIARGIVWVKYRYFIKP